MKILLKIILFIIFILFIYVSESFSQTPSYTLNVTNDQQTAANLYEFDIYLLRAASNSFEYANNSQYFIDINPAIINGGALTFTILAGTCDLNAVQQILSAKVSFDAVNNRLRIAAHSPSGAGTGTIIANTGLGTRLGRFRVTNTVNFAAAQSNLKWYNFHSGFYTKVFAYISGLNVEITDSTTHVININNNSLPVIISLFNANVSRNGVTLYWTTAQEINNYGFEVYRTIKERNDWINIGFIQGNGTTNEPKNYKFENTKLQTAVYNYKLKQFDYNGNFTYYPLNSDVTVGKPGKFGISQNYPNPSNPKCKIDYEMPAFGKVTIKVYDLLGREIVTLVNETKDAGYYSAEFDGSNLASGIYLYNITADGDGVRYIKTLKMVLVK
jgi:hypothetical protein